jgi:hypothetical protein
MDITNITNEHNYACKPPSQLPASTSSQQSIHSPSPSLNTREYSCPDCSFKHKNKRTMKFHYTTTHNYNLTTNSLSFNSFQEFEAWKDAITEKENVQYFIDNTNKIENGKRIHYYCHRNGFYKGRGKGLRKLKSNGSNKIDYHCPSSMVCDVLPERVDVKYCETHIGHSMKVGLLNLTKTEKDLISEKINMKIPYDEIMRQVRGGEPLKKEDIKR